MGQTTNLEFTTLNPTDIGGYTSINTCIASIDTKLTNRVAFPGQIMFFARYINNGGTILDMTIPADVTTAITAELFPAGWGVITGVQASTTGGANTPLVPPTGLVYITKGALP
jgi:hypothetical protein